jgi:hypothetical protein
MVLTLGRNEVKAPDQLPKSPRFFIGPRQPRWSTDSSNRVVPRPELRAKCGYQGNGPSVGKAEAA